MMKFWLALLITLVAALSGLALRREQSADVPPYITAVLPEGSTWQGIEPGVTPYKDARTLISELPNAEAQMEKDTWLFSADGIHWHGVWLDAKTTTITLTPDHVPLGEVMLALGKPDYQAVQFEIIAQKFSDIRVVSLYYLARKVVVTLRVEGAPRLSPEIFVSSLEYLAQAPFPPRGAELWQGFQRLPTSPSFTR